MTETTVKVGASLELRLSALFVQAASKFACEVQLRIGTKTINAKSIMGVISLGILDGQDITIIADGIDEENAIEELSRFFAA